MKGSNKSSELELQFKSLENTKGLFFPRKELFIYIFRVELSNYSGLESYTWRCLTG